MSNPIRSMCLATVLVSGILALSMAQTAIPPVKVDTVQQKVAAAGMHAAKLQPQTTCPVTGDPIDKKLYIDYKGKRIYVCCSSCIDSVKKDPEKYIKKLESMGQGVETIGGKSMKKSKNAKADTSTASEAGYWTCPMHPEIHKTEAGQCPICGMNLEYKAHSPNKKSTDVKADTAMKGMKM
jgi:YHS domain-containing protein